MFAILKFQHTSILSLANTIVCKHIIQLTVALWGRYLLNSGEFSVFYIIEYCAIFCCNPAFMIGTVQNKAVSKIGMLTLKHCTLITFQVCRIVIRIQTVLLTQRTTSKVIRLRAADAGLVIDLAAVDNGKPMICVPLCARLDVRFQARNNAKRVCRGCINWAVHLDPVCSQGEC